MTDTCVCCGEYVGEGKQVCATCQNARKPLTVTINVENKDGLIKLLERAKKQMAELAETVKAIETYDFPEYLPR